MNRVALFAYSRNAQLPHASGADEGKNFFPSLLTYFVNESQSRVQIERLSAQFAAIVDEWHRVEMPQQWMLCESHRQLGLLAMQYNRLARYA